MSAADQLRRDFLPFIDPATELTLTEGSHGVRLQFIRNGAEQDYFIDLPDMSVFVRPRGRRFASVRSLLASAEFADVKSLAATQMRMLRDLDVEKFIPPEGELDSNLLSRQALNRCLSTTRYAEGTAGSKIGLVLIDGPAGVGKTSLITALLLQRAKRQQETSALPPILHVASRGKKISGLNQVLAESIDLIRAKFTFDQTPTLIRHNLVQVAIDGFDELVDDEGYKDAWFALKQFFEDTVSGGPIIFAGRDTFFDQQSFERQLKSFRYEFEIHHVRLNPVSPKVARQWLTARGWGEADLRDPLTSIILRPGAYALRPYFLSELALAGGWKAIDSQDLTPRAFLVEKFLQREAVLISQQLASIPQGEVRQGLQYIFEEIALEMAGSESDVIDLSFLQLVTEAGFSQKLSNKDLAKLIHKAGNFALLESDVREGYRRFPHTEILYHFLAAGIIRTIVANTRSSVLRRGTFTSDFLSIFVELFSAEPKELARKFVESIDRMMLDEATFDRLPENAGALAISSLCHDFSSDERKYSDIAIIDSVLAGVVSPAELQRIRIQRLDAKEADLEQMKFIDCEIVQLNVDETTRFGTTRPSIHRLLIETEDGKVKEIFDPSEISEWLEEHSVSPQPDSLANEEALRLFERVCRVMLRQHVIKEHPSDAWGRYLQEPYWREIEDILFARGLADRISKRTAGSNASFIRLKEPLKILVHRTEPQIKEIWDSIAALPSD